MKKINYNLPFIFSKNYGNVNHFTEKEKEYLIDKFNLLNKTNYFSVNDKNINKSNKKDFDSSNLFKIYNIKNFKKFLEPAKYTSNLNDNEDILTTIL